MAFLKLYCGSMFWSAKEPCFISAASKKPGSPPRPWHCAVNSFVNGRDLLYTHSGMGAQLPDWAVQNMSG